MPSHVVRVFKGPAIGLLMALAVALAASPARAATPNHPLLFTLFASAAREGPSPPHPPYPPPFEGFEDACGVAIDSAGDIYVSDYYHDAVDVFNSSREYLTQIKAESPANGPCGLAVDPAGNVYVDNWRQNVVRFTPSSYPPTRSTKYGPGTVIDSGRSTGVTLDPATGDLYVDDRTYVARYQAPVLAGEEPVKIGLGTLGSGYGVAVSDFPATAGSVYVPDAFDNTVKVYEPAVDPVNPAAVIDGAGSPQAGFRNLTDSDVAVDQGNGHVYVADSLEEPFEHPAAVVDEFNAAAAYRGQLPHQIVDGEPSALAVDGAGNVYVTSGNSEEAVLYAFGPTAPGHTVEVLEAGTGSGTVTSAPFGISCGSACAAEYTAGEVVILTATPSPTSVFEGFSGGGCHGTGHCQLSLGADTVLTATFATAPPAAANPALAIAPTPTPTFTVLAPAGSTASPESHRAVAHRRHRNHRRRHREHRGSPAKRGGG